MADDDEAQRLRNAAERRRRRIIEQGNDRMKQVAPFGDDISIDSGRAQPNSLTNGTNPIMSGTSMGSIFGNDDSTTSERRGLFKTAKGVEHWKNFLIGIRSFLVLFWAVLSAVVTVQDKQACWGSHQESIPMFVSSAISTVAPLGRSALDKLGGLGVLFLLHLITEILARQDAIINVTRRWFGGQPKSADDNDMIFNLVSSMFPAATPLASWLPHLSKLLTVVVILYRYLLDCCLYLVVFKLAAVSLSMLQGT